MKNTWCCRALKSVEKNPCRISILTGKHIKFEIKIVKSSLSGNSDKPGKTQPRTLPTKDGHGGKVDHSTFFERIKSAGIIKHRDASHSD
jgi:hypothetical protein